MSELVMSTVVVKALVLTPQIINILLENGKITFSINSVSSFRILNRFLKKQNKTKKIKKTSGSGVSYFV